MSYKFRRELDVNNEVFILQVIEPLGGPRICERKFSASCHSSE